MHYTYPSCAALLVIGQWCAAMDATHGEAVPAFFAHYAFAKDLLSSQNGFKLKMCI